MTRYLHYKSGTLYGIRYDFDEVGDGLPAHSHGTDLAHNIIVLRGSVRFEAVNAPPVDLVPGVIFDFDWTKRHTVVALEPNTTVLHLMLHGMPRDYDSLPPSELQGQFSCRAGMH